MEKRKVLIVDDDLQIGNLLSAALSDKYEVLSAKSGEEAIKKAVINQPSCIMLDVMMPEMGGFMVCEILKSLKQTQRIPIVLLSGKSRDELLPTALEMGALDCLEKPFSIPQICEAVNRALNVAPVERRRTPRVKMKIPVIVRGKDIFENDFEVCSNTENVSRLGTLVNLPVKVHVGDMIELKPMAYPSQDNSSPTSQARVVWADEGILGDYHYGLEFNTLATHWVIQR